MSKNSTPDLNAQLHKVLSNSYALSVKTQNFHWNVTGSNFYSIHKLLDAQYEEYVEAIDEIAEHIRTLGYKVPAGFAVFSKSQIIEDGDESSTAQQMLSILAKDNEELIKIINEALKKSEEAQDDVISDFLIGRLNVHKKNVWMLKSSI